MIKKILSIILITLILIFSILLYSRFLGVRGLKTHEIVLYEDIPDSFDGLKIVHFSDIHYKKVIREDTIRKLVREINRLKPDLVLFTGDLLDEDYELSHKDIKFLVKELSKIESKYGNYAVLGDQDISLLENVLNIYLQSDFILLDNENQIIQNENNDKFALLGISSSLKKKDDIDKAFDKVNDDIYQIVTVHEPDYADTILSKHNSVNLILVAHSIHGSINLPIINRLLLPVGAKKYYRSHYLIHNTHIYVSNGIGVNQVNFRFLNTPSINFYRIKKK